MSPSAIETPEARSEGQPGGLTELRAAGAAREAGIGLCLSGGGFRAMLFHVGALWRLYDTGMLGGIKRISSVSGGSITAGQLGLKWRRLSFDPAKIQEDFVPEVVGPIRKLADQTLDVSGVIGGSCCPARSPTTSPRRMPSISTPTRPYRICPTSPASSSTLPASRAGPCGASPSRIWAITGSAWWSILPCASRARWRPRPRSRRCCHR